MIGVWRHPHVNVPCLAMRYFDSMINSDLNGWDVYL